MAQQLQSPWFDVCEAEIMTRAAGVVLPDKEQWLSEQDERTEHEWDQLSKYMTGQTNIASVIAPTLNHLSWTHVPHDFAEQAAEWATVWECWNAGARMTLPHPAMMFDFAVEEPYVIASGQLVYHLYGAVVTGTPGGGILVHPLGGPPVWEGMLHYAPFALVPDAVADKLESGLLPWGYDEAVIRRPGSPAVQPPFRAQPARLAQWAGSLATSVVVGLLNYGDFDTAAL